MNCAQRLLTLRVEFAALQALPVINPNVPEVIPLLSPDSQIQDALFVIWIVIQV